MKTKILFITTLILFTFSGCSKPETKFYEKGGKTYFVDKKGEVVKFFTIKKTTKIQRFIENQKMDIFHLYERQTYVTVE
jgi:hypothetical protein